MQEKQSRNQGKKRKRQTGEGDARGDPASEGETVKRERAEEEERATVEGEAESQGKTPEAVVSGGEANEI